jgi:hypothetical protein
VRNNARPVMLVTGICQVSTGLGVQCNLLQLLKCHFSPARSTHTTNLHIDLPAALRQSGNWFAYISNIAPFYRTAVYSVFEGRA